jgi:MFS family permease
VSNTRPTAPPSSALGDPQQMRRVLFSSFLGSAVEFYDFLLYGTAAALVFGQLFFSDLTPVVATIASFATLAVGYIVRPLGGVVFGHFGDRIGRKTTLVAALMTMGLSTVTIGLLPPYSSIGLAAPLLLAICRFGQGLGLGGELGGAVLLAVENAPPGRRAWYGMFPQLGAPIGFILSGGVFLALSTWLSDEQFFTFGWRLPFLASIALVGVGLYVRLTLTETRIFSAALNRRERVKLPMLDVFRDHAGTVALGVVIALSAFVSFYLMSVFALTWGTGSLGFSRERFLVMQLFADLFFAFMIPVSARLAEHGRRRLLIGVNAAIAAFGVVLGPLFGAGTFGALTTLVLGMALVGLVYGPLGTVLSELFPTAVRYSGSSLTFNLAGIFGASLTPYVATYLAQHHGLEYVGYYLSAGALLSLAALLAMRETKDDDWK